MKKGKVIIAFLIACTALYLAWSVSNVAFREMLGTVRQATEPNEKLRIVNNLYRRITLLEQLQGTYRQETPDQTFSRFRKESRLLRESLDTLKTLYEGNDIQARRVNSMKNLLEQRERLFADYLLIRDTIVSNRVLTGEVASLTEILADKSRLPDSTTILKSENRYTTTVIPARREETPAGFLRRLFGRRKAATADTTPQKIINEELSITFDTIASAQKDTLFKTVDSALVSLQRKQKQQTGRFINRERQLREAGHVLVSQMLGILEQVETEVVRQTRENQARTSFIVSESSREMKLIVTAFFLVTVALLYFILRDITRNNRYRHKLELANQQALYHSAAKQRFLSNMSHEIRTPLQAIMGYAEQAKQQQRTGKKNIDAIYNSSAHLLQIVNEVLDYSTIISGKFTFNNSVFRLKSLLDEVITILNVQAAKKALALHLAYDLDEDLHLNGDPFRLKQIIYNLLGNALKFTVKGSVRMTVSGKDNDGQVHLNIQVEDTGPGIAPEDIDHIFGEFERADENSYSPVSGTGLGLTIVKTLVSSQNGRIYVKSERGKGSCFNVYIPFEKADTPENVQPAERSRRGSYPGKVWMVDDDGFILQLCSSIFEKNDIPYKCFSSPENILSEPVDEKLSCVLLDMRMPGMNGAELCRILRKKLPKGMYIFALTAQALPWEQESVMRQGFDGLLMKPFTESELVDLVFSTDEEIDATEQALPDLEFVRDMVFGDNEKMSAIVRQFIEDSENDLRLIEQFSGSQQVDDLLLVLHRVAGRTAQIGARELAGDFRMCEIQLDRTKKISGELKNNLNRLCSGLEDLCVMIEQRAEHTSGN